MVNAEFESARFTLGRAEMNPSGACHRGRRGPRWTEYRKNQMPAGQAAWASPVSNTASRIIAVAHRRKPLSICGHQAMRAIDINTAPSQTAAAT
jgi:hypothetical protein